MDARATTEVPAERRSSAPSRPPSGTTTPETIAAIRRLLIIARFDVAVLLLVVADMITKPFS